METKEKREKKFERFAHAYIGGFVSAVHLQDNTYDEIFEASEEFQRPLRDGGLSKNQIILSAMIEMTTIILHAYLQSDHHKKTVDEENSFQGD